MTRLLPVLVTTAVLLLGFAACAVQFPAMASLRVVANLLTDNAFLGIVAVGMTFVIIAGGIDLSVGSVIGFTTVFLALAIQRCGLPPWVAFGAVLLVCAAFGTAMGVAIHVLDLPPFIVTLAGMFLARGVAFLLTTDSIAIDAPFYANLPDHAFSLPGGARLDWLALVMLAAFGVGGVVLHGTRFGAVTFALGGSRVSTALMGVRTGPATIRIYALSSTLAGLAGVVFSLYTASGNPLAASGVELDTIAAVVIGGTLLSGGAGFMAGSFVGVLIQGLIQTYITFDGTLSSWWAKIVTGGMLFAFIAFQRATVGLARDRRA